MTVIVARCSDRRGLEARLAVAREPVVAGDPQVDRHHPLADQAVRQVAGDVGLGLAPVEVAAGRLDGQGQRPAQLAKPLPLQRASAAGAGPRGRRRRAAQGGVRGAEVADHPLVVAQLGDDPARLVEPGALLELEAQAGQLLLEDPGALDVVGDHRPAGPVDEEQDRADFRAEVVTRGRPPR